MEEVILSSNNELAIQFYDRKDELPPSLVNSLRKIELKLEHEIIDQYPDLPTEEAQQAFLNQVKNFKTLCSKMKS